MAIKIQGQTVIDDNQNINVTGTVTATNYILPNGSSIADSASITVSETAPATASLDEGALWWNSSADDASLYVLYADPDSLAKYWVPASPSISTGGGSGGGSIIVDAGDFNSGSSIAGADNDEVEGGVFD
jgi:hypothetical protein